MLTSSFVLLRDLLRMPTKTLPQTSTAPFNIQADIRKNSKASHETTLSTNPSQPFKLNHTSTLTRRRRFIQTSWDLLISDAFENHPQRTSFKQANSDRLKSLDFNKDWRALLGGANQQGQLRKSQLEDFFFALSTVKLPAILFETERW